MDIARIQDILSGEDTSELEAYLATSEQNGTDLEGATAKIAELEAAASVAAEELAALVSVHEAEVNRLKAANYDALHAGDPDTPAESSDGGEDEFPSLDDILAGLKS